MFVTCNRRSLGIITENCKKKPTLQKQQDEQRAYPWFSFRVELALSLPSLLERAVRICAFTSNAQQSEGSLESILSWKLQVEERKNSTERV